MKSTSELSEVLSQAEPVNLIRGLQCASPESEPYVLASTIPSTEVVREDRELVTEILVVKVGLIALTKPPVPVALAPLIVGAFVISRLVNQPLLTRVPVKPTVPFVTNVPSVLILALSAKLGAKIKSVLLVPITDVSPLNIRSPRLALLKPM